MRLATSSYNPTSLMLCCAQPCQCVLSQPVANAHSSSSSVAPSRPTFAQRWQWGQFRATPNTAILFFSSPFRPHLLKVSKNDPNAPVFDILKTVLCAFCRQIEPHNRRNRDPPSAPPRATLPEKAQGVAPVCVFTCEFTRFWTATLPNYLMMGNANHDNRP